MHLEIKCKYTHLRDRFFRIVVKKEWNVINKTEKPVYAKIFLKFSSRLRNEVEYLKIYTDLYFR